MGKCYSLPEIEAMALEYNIALKSDRLVLDGIRSEKEQAGKKNNWRLHGGYSVYGRGVKPTQSWTEEPSPLGERLWTEVVWTYPVWERWYKLKYTDREKQAQLAEHQAELEHDRLEVLYQVRKAYWLVQQYGRLSRGAQDSLRQLKELTKQIKLRREYGFSLDSEVMEAEGALLTRRKESERFKRAYDHQLQNLARLAGADVNITSARPAGFKIPPQEKLKSTLKGHPALAVLEARARREGTLADASRFKNLNIWAESGGGVRAYQDSKIKLAARFGVGFSIPIGYDKAERLERQSHLSRQDSWDALRYAKLQDMEGELAQIYLEMDSIAREQKSVIHRIDEAREKIRILEVQQEFDAAGDSSPWQKMIQALQFQWEARKRFTELKYQKWLCYARLQRLTGIGPEETGASVPRQSHTE